MKKYLLLTVAGIGSALSLFATPITPEQALQRLGNNTRGHAVDSRPVFTERQTNGEAAIYVFNQGNDGGYLLLSADDCAAPLLGYADSGKFDEKEMSPEMKWWLSEYARQIEYANKRGLGEYKSTSTRAAKKAVAPLVKTKWNQSSPYNGMTPTVNGQHCVTGCVATSTAQIMKFWNYPEIGTGESNCYVQDNSGNTTEESMNFGDQPFDWNNMLDVYDSSATQAQKDAVAYLMKCTGYGVHMTYTSNESGASSIYIADALVNNFGYNKNLRYCDRDYYNPEEWEDMVYGELAAGRPLVYGGQSIQGGHSFVCDGYSADGFYHFNWGWGGMSDGYFSLNALDPSSLGIGANGGGYNFTQNIVVGIQPSTGEYLGRDIVIEGTIEGSSSANQITLKCTNIWNYSGIPLIASFGYSIETPDGTVTYKSVSDNYELGVYSGFSSLNLPCVLSTSLPDGTYKVTLCFQEAGESQWFPVKASQLGYNYVMVTKKGTRYTVEKNKTLNINIEDIAVIGELAYGQVARLSVTVSNPTDRYVTKPIYPVLCDGTKPVMVAQGVTLDIDAGEEITREFDCVFSLIKGASAPTADKTYKLRFYDPSVYSYYEDPTALTMYPGKIIDANMIKGEDPVLKITDLSMPGLESVTNNGNKIYTVTDLTKVPVKLTISNTGGYFANAIEMMVYKNGGDGYMYYVSEYPFPEVVPLAKGDKKTLDLTFDLSACTEEAVYGAYFYSTDFIKGSGKDAVIYFTVNTAGVGEIIVEQMMTITYNRKSSTVNVSGASDVKEIGVYATDGKRCYAEVRMNGDEATVDLSSLPQGIYVVKAIAGDGKTGTLKVLR